MQDHSRKRHIAKTITWRIVGTIDTILLGMDYYRQSIYWVENWIG